MSKVCQVTGKKPVTGNNVSHAMNRTRRRFEPNLHYHRFWVESENRFVRLRVSSKGKIRLVSSAGTGHFYTTDKNKRTMPEKMEIKKFDPVIRQHVIYKEAKIK